MKEDYAREQEARPGYFTRIANWVDRNRAKTAAVVFLAVGYGAREIAEYSARAVNEAIPSAHATGNGQADFVDFSRFGTQNLENVTQVLGVQLDGDNAMDLAVVANRKLILLRNQINLKK